MVLFDFKSEGHFVASFDRSTLKIYELTNPTIHPSYIRKTHWRKVVDISPRDQYHDSDVDDGDEGDGDDDDAATAAKESTYYDGLMFFDGHGKIEGREELTKLAQHLTRLQLMVSPEGYCYQNVIELGEHKDFGIQYLRLNDLFNWPNHGISMTSITTWRRVVLKYTIPRREGKRPTTGGVSKEKYEELKNKMREKDEELEKLMEEMEEQDGDIHKLKEEREEASEQQEAELRDLEKRKDEELRKLLMKNDAELVMLRKEKDDEVKTLKEEVENLRRANNEDEARAKKVREVGKEDMMKANAAETRNLRDQLSNLHELEQRRKQTWVWNNSHRTFNNYIVDVTKRRRVPGDTWHKNVCNHFYSYEAYATGGSSPFPMANWVRVDEDPKDWQPPPKIGILCRPDQFDKNNWWFMKTVHPDGGLTMVAYYDGNQTCFTDTNGHLVRLPFPRNCILYTEVHLFLTYVDGIYRLAFPYRD